MTTLDAIARWLLQSTLFCGLVLTVGAVAVRLVRQPADRLRLIYCVFAGCLIAPWVSDLNSWKAISLNLLRVQQSARPVTKTDAMTNVSPPIPTPSARVSDRVNESSLKSDAKGLDATSPSAAGAFKAPVAASSGMPLQPVPPITADMNLPLFSPLQIVSAFVVALYFAALFAMVLWRFIGLAKRCSLERSARLPSADLAALCEQMVTSANLPIRLRISDEIRSPITWGLLRPIILLPSSFVTDMESPRLRCCLAHELSHIERRDVGGLFLAWMVQLVGFYLPFYWGLRRQMMMCQDFLADARAAQESDSTEDYADFLVSLAIVHRLPQFAGTLGIVDGNSSLFRRVRMLLTWDGSLASRCSRSAALGSAIGTLLFLAVLSTIRLDALESAARKSESIVTNDTPAIPVTANPVAAEPVAVERVDESQLEPGVITGVVINSADGSPVADADVILTMGPPKTTRTDSQGRFRLEKRQRHAVYQVWAYSGNLTSPKVAVRLAETAQSDEAKYLPLVLRLSEGKRARFTVTSALTGKPIAGASVVFQYPDKHSAITDGSGVAAVEGLLPESHQVTVNAEGYAFQMTNIDLSSSAEKADYKLILVAGGRVRGTVVDLEGTPVSGAYLWYRFPGDAQGFGGNDSRTNDKGHFQHRFLPLDTAVQVEVRKNGFLPQNQTIVVRAAQPELEVRMVLNKKPVGGSISGTVKDEKGNPIANAQIQNDGNSSANRKISKSNAAGEFVLHDLEKSWKGYEVSVSAKGYAPKLVQVEPGTADNPTAVPVVLEPGHQIHGRILFEDGSPAEGALVYCRSPAYGLINFVTCRTRKDGGFQLDSLPADGSFEVTMEGYPGLYNTSWKMDGQEPVIATLEAPAVIFGRVLDSNTKQPVKNFRVSVTFSPMAKPSDPRGTYDNRWTHPGVSFESQTGEFTIMPMANGFPIQVTIEADGYDRSVVNRAVAAKRNLAKPIDVRLNPVKLTQLSTLKGQFLDHAGKPKPNVELRLIVSTEPPTGSDDNQYNWTLIQGGQLLQKPYCEQFLSGTTNAEGRFEFKQLLPGKSLQLAYWGVGVPQAKSLAFDETKAGSSDEVTIRLPEPAKVKGMFDRMEFPDAESIQLYMQTVGGPSYELQLEKNQSTFEFGDLPSGSFSISLLAKPVPEAFNGSTLFTSKPISSATASLKAGQTFEIRFTKRISN